MLSGVTAAGATFLCFCLVLLVIFGAQSAASEVASRVCVVLKGTYDKEKKSPYSKK